MARSLRRLRNLLFLRHNIVEEMFIDHQLISSLLKCDSEHFLVLDRCRHIVRIDLDDIVIAVFLGL